MERRKLEAAYLFKETLTCKFPSAMLVTEEKCSLCLACIELDQGHVQKAALSLEIQKIPPTKWVDEYRGEYLCDLR